MEEDDRYTRITLRIPKTLHSQIANSAEETSKSLNAEIVARLQKTADWEEALRRQRDMSERIQHESAHLRVKLDKLYAELTEKNTEGLKVSHQKVVAETQLAECRKRVDQLQFALDDRPKFEDLKRDLDYMHERLAGANKLVQALQDSVASRNSHLLTVRESQGYWIEVAVRLADRLRGMYEKLPKDDAKDPFFITAYEHSIETIRMATQWLVIRNIGSRATEILKYTSIAVVADILSPDDAGGADTPP